MTVSDTGTGIPANVLPHIFDPFFTTKGAGKGSGLGLSQVHGIVGSHEGHIDVDSRVGQGTVFTIYLPALSVKAPEPPALAGLSLPKGQGETILLVEDNDAAREALAESLDLLNYRVMEASNGQEALEILEQHGERIALVLSDVIMPVMGGIALLYTLRERDIGVGVVLLTGHPLEKETQKLHTQRAASHLVGWLFKPAAIDQLAEVVARALGARDEDE
jgi:CheY-like chemotaxis protein